MTATLSAPTLTATPARLERKPYRWILIVDVETTGLDPGIDKPCEVALALFDVEHLAIVAQVSYLLPVLNNPVAAINNIPASLTTAIPRLDIVLGAAASNLWREADVVLAHNAAYDREWFERFDLMGEPVDDRPWLCSMSDFRWKAPGLRENPSLTDLALAHGVPVWAAHRAAPDVVTLASILSKRHDLAALVEDARTPQFLYEAMVSFAQKDKAKEFGFRWSAHGYDKAWTRFLRAEEAAVLPFGCQQLIRAGGRS
jgi:DNA polymerase-3 subunit epsilon